MAKQRYKVRFVLHNAANICCVVHIIDTASSQDPHDEVERQGQSPRSTHEDGGNQLISPIRSSLFCPCFSFISPSPIPSRTPSN